MNDYKQKLGQVESNRCECGEVETTEHFLLECQQYEDQRLQLLFSLQSQVGITHLDTLELLSYEDKEDFKGWRDTVTTSHCSYIEKTGRYNQTNSVGRCVIPCAFFGKSVKHTFSCRRMYPV